MRLLIVHRNAQDLNILIKEFVVRITERARFFRSARCVVFRVKKQDDPFAPKILEIYRIAVLIAGVKFGSLIAFLEHNPPKNITSVSVKVNCNTVNWAYENNQ